MTNPLPPYSFGWTSGLLAGVYIPNLTAEEEVIEAAGGKSYRVWRLTASFATRAQAEVLRNRIREVVVTSLERSVTGKAHAHGGGMVTFRLSGWPANEFADVYVKSGGYTSRRTPFNAERHGRTVDMELEEA